MKLRYLAVAALAGALSFALVNGAIGARRSEAPKPRAFFATLLGKNGVDDKGHRGAGDPNGRGGFTAVIDGNQFCYGIVVRNIADSNKPPAPPGPIRAHVHEGSSNSHGPIRITLEPPPSTGDPGSASGCLTVTDTKLLGEITKTPGKFYVNIHNGKFPFPAEAVRGRLFGLTK